MDHLHGGSGNRSRPDCGGHSDRPDAVQSACREWGVGTSDHQKDRGMIKSAEKRSSGCIGGKVVGRRAAERADYLHQSHSGFTVWEADNPHLALEILEGEQPLDPPAGRLRYPANDGVVVINRARALQRRLRAMLMSGQADILHAGGAEGTPCWQNHLESANCAGVSQMSCLDRGPPSLQNLPTHSFLLSPGKDRRSRCCLDFRLAVPIPTLATGVSKFRE
jgi:hypothetical protein